MQMHTGVYRSVGEGHRKNQDSLSLQHIMLRRGECLLAVVCDGIGSLDSAEEAGGIAVSKLTDWFYHEGKELIYQRASKEKIIIALQKQILHIQEFLQYFQQKEQLQTGTTCSGLLIIRNRYYLIHIGDSRVYQLEKCSVFWQRYCGKPFYRLKQLTSDDHDERGRLRKALGMAGTDRAVFQTGTIRRKTGFLICTDGFYQGNDMCLAGQMLGTLLHRENKLLPIQIKRRLEQLGKAAWEYGNRDDKAAIGILIK